MQRLFLSLPSPPPVVSLARRRGRRRLRRRGGVHGHHQLLSAAVQLHLREQRRRRVPSDSSRCRALAGTYTNSLLYLGSETQISTHHSVQSQKPFTVEVLYRYKLVYIVHSSKQIRFYLNKFNLYDSSKFQSCTSWADWRGDRTGPWPSRKITVFHAARPIRSRVHRIHSRKPIQIPKYSALCLVNISKGAARVFEKNYLY